MCDFRENILAKRWLIFSRYIVADTCHPNTGVRSYAHEDRNRCGGTHRPPSRQASVTGYTIRKPYCVMNNPSKLLPPVSWTSSSKIVRFRDGDEIRRIIIEGFDNWLQPCHIHPLQGPFIILVDMRSIISAAASLLFHLHGIACAVCSELCLQLSILFLQRRKFFQLFCPRVLRYD